MFPVIVLAGLSALAAAALWCIDQRLDSGAATSRSRWCYGTYISTTGGRTLIITGCGIGTTAIAVTEPTPPAPAVLPPQPNAHSPAAPVAPSDVPVTVEYAGGPRTADDADKLTEPAELVELEQLWLLPPRCPSAAAPAIAAAAPASEV
jgi:hypothetical protein